MVHQAARAPSSGRAEDVVLMGVADDHGEAARVVEVWSAVLDFVARLAQALAVTGWSLGVLEEGRVHTHSRGFDAGVSASYADLSPDVALPGPVTIRTGRDQFFATNEEAHALYPLARGIDAGGGHDGAAVLGLRSPDEQVCGYLALHLAAGHEALDQAEQERLARVARSVEAVVWAAVERS